jgi:hypothetical protein
MADEPLFNADDEIYAIWSELNDHSKQIKLNTYATMGLAVGVLASGAMGFMAIKTLTNMTKGLQALAGNQDAIAKHIGLVPSDPAPTPTSDSPVGRAPTKAVRIPSDPVPVNNDGAIDKNLIGRTGPVDKGAEGPASEVPEGVHAKLMEDAEALGPLKDLAKGEEV